METEDLEFKDILKHLDRESAHVVVRLETRPKGRVVTIVKPHSLIQDAKALASLARRLKESLGTGGSVKEGEIVLQGDQREHVKRELVKLGFQEESVEMV